MLHCVIGLLKVHEADEQGPSQQNGLVNEVAQSKQMINCRLARTKPSLDRAAQPMLLRLGNQPGIQDDCVETVQRLPHCDGPIVRWVESAALFVDGGDKARADAGRQLALDTQAHRHWSS